jgi:hypothetical protein
MRREPKNGEHAGIGVRQCLARTVDVEEAQRDRVHAIGLADDQRHLLLCVFIERVD